MVMVIKGTIVVPVVLPTVILTKGAMLRPLAEQTANLLPSLTPESTPAPEVHDGGRPFSGDSSQADINKNVGFYVGSTNDAQRRKGEHENATNNPSSQSYGGKHYIIARKSQQQHRHMIPLVVFDANVPIHLLMMTEQTLTLAFRSYQLALFVPVDTRSSVPFVE
ncbi:hypothetical protein Forpe1208_v008661 [Fusarium oxysporum f. sp. rapae]|uniref:Uncharacterized protein n=1 Tax=Fusarium oxysporum f. sp. rapae TaxID=485398 RepID=A0A8J5P6I5_FUSOX|nr:hypothetical protein Forpe1208_v008661 [Fusarium oxysporum f. sp. rapae]